MDLSARAFALYRKLTTLFSAERYHRTGESSIAQNGGICTREPVRLTDVVETSYPGTQGWYGLQRIFPLEFFLGGLTGIADRFGLRRTTDESK